jgi:hypothetical protein
VQLLKVIDLANFWELGGGLLKMALRKPIPEGQEGISCLFIISKAIFPDRFVG